MTETQAKSGASGASTDAEDTSVETSAAPDDGGNQSSVSALADALESPTTVVRMKPSLADDPDSDTGSDSGDNKATGDGKAPVFSWPAASAASTVAPSSPGSSTGGSTK